MQTSKAIEQFGAVVEDMLIKHGKKIIGECVTRHCWLVGTGAGGCSCDSGVLSHAGGEMELAIRSARRVGSYLAQSSRPVSLFPATDEQFVLKRIADGAIDIYAMVVVLSRCRDQNPLIPSCLPPPPFKNLLNVNVDGALLCSELPAR